MRYNPATADSYKYSHYCQFPKGMTNAYYYIEPRKGKRVVNFGPQMWLKEYGSKQLTQTDLNRRARIMQATGVPAYVQGFQRIIDKHDGYLPLLIKALPEGMVVPTHNALVTVEATDPELFWLPGFIETGIHRGVWYPTTVATNSYECKQIIKKYLELTCDNPNAVIDFMLHDFGARGASSRETAGIGGAAHLVNFKGTDTVEALDWVLEYYGDESKSLEEQMPAFSIPAAEHSTITAWGRNHEIEAYENMLATFAKKGTLVAVVSDSYDIYNSVDVIWGEILRERVKASGARVVIRPDSGNPVEVLPRLLNSLAKNYGATKNKKGFLVLHESVRLIQGDGITIDTIPTILQAILDAGFSTENVAFGMGAGLLQKVDRDTYGFAMKESAVMIDGVWRDAYKDPITDPGKASKKGRLVVHSDGGHGIETFRDDGASAWRDMLKPVFLNGKILKNWTFEEIRNRAASS